MMVGKPAGLKPRRLTDSGVYYLPFGQPRGWGGAGVVQLHVADGSQVVSVGDGSKLTVFVGARGKERYGSCPSRLETPRLAQGYLPILDTAYPTRRASTTGRSRSRRGSHRPARSSASSA
jgi:hypothetical protein